MEEQQKKELEIHKSELECLQAEKSVKAAHARLEAYDREVKQENDIYSVHRDPASQSHVSHSANQQSNEVRSTSTNDISFLAQAVQDSIAMNRLPVPEPTVFNGNPLHFIEWKASFMSLIDRKNIPASDKLHFLKRYVSGSAQKYLEGTFYRKDEEAYNDAWKKLNRRYGQPFIIQRAFREKLSDWPKLQSKDAEGLRDFSDFLNACLQAMPHVKGLDILNDCEENQKLTLKLPDWLATRWNRQVTIALTEGKEFPCFQDFVQFMTLEAEIACNPITSTFALRSSESYNDQRNTKIKRNKASVLNTQTLEDSNDHPANQERKKTQCMLCHDTGHYLHKCPEFMSKSLESRRAYVKDNRLCYGCLRLGHGAKECRRRHTCELCKGRHPTCLHDDNYKKTTKGPWQSKDSRPKHETEPTAVMSLNVHSKGQEVSTSMIVPVWVSYKRNPSKEKLVYALLDTQSDTTFIDEDVSKELQVATQPVKLKLTTMMGENRIMKSERVSDLCVRGYDSTIHIDLPSTYTKDCIPANREHIPTRETAKHWEHLTTIADSLPPLLDCEVGLLIGYNCPRTLVPRRVISGKDNEPYAILTDLGWSIVGCSTLQAGTFMATGHCHRVTVKELPAMTPVDAIKILESDFKDTHGDGKTVSQEDLIFLDILRKGIRKNEQGHYEMPLPFKERPCLPDNRQLAIIRLNHLKRKFSVNEKYKDNYIIYMKDLIERGDVEEVHEEGAGGEKWYIPHHGVYHSKKPDKLRVVFDCSARHKGNSLNEHLLSGPDMINNLTGVLIRFRQHHIALMCDTEKMFHQFHVPIKDRDYLRFLWWTNGDTNTQPRDYRMKVHLFGAVSSPGCANYGLKQLAKDNSHLYPMGAQFIARDFYVDDGVTSVESAERAIELALEARELCANGGLRLHKFVSNSNVVLQSIPPSERATDTKTKNLTLNDMSLERALGIHWDIESDSFTFKITAKDQPATRRGILSTVASIYDPLGIVAPYLLNGKGILQEMCHQGTGWDDLLPERLRPRWERWLDDLTNLERISIARCYVPTNFGKVNKRELHHFSDASNKGYGQCSYLRLKNEKGEVHCALIMGKARVSPLKVVTIPRLELTAAVVSVTVSNMLKEELSYTNVEEFFWTDSKVVLGYINNDARRFHTFVANRVQKIRHCSNPQQWAYISTDENPADNASRGRTIDELLSSNWFTGPKFLWEKEIKPSTELIHDLPIGDPEVKRSHVLQTRTKEQVTLADRLSKFSSWSRAIKAVARLLRRVKKDKSNTLSTVKERQSAELLFIKDLQKQAYENEIKLLSKGSQLPIHNKLYSLDVFLDKDGVLKVGGRLGHSSSSSSFKHPKVIPKGHHITSLIIAHYHEKVKHQGKGFTINEIRSNGYWITGLNRAVASHIHQCVTCRKLRRPVEGQRMSDLPTERVEPSPPFTFCGMDCFGPFLTKQGRKQHKSSYGGLFCINAQKV
ncbi:uncharacterized protein LOC134310729 [Trichomycterus rosablanca]|uniref:uncharacterized protein LOC134310729 n=1 Tax=Trichomycterus rosablanca TaxID=2290929 RepID=UPI002F35EDCA